jgi:hypothetical protein
MRNRYMNSEGKESNGAEIGKLKGMGGGECIKEGAEGTSFSRKL